MRSFYRKWRSSSLQSLQVNKKHSATPAIISCCGGLHQKIWVLSHLPHQFCLSPLLLSVFSTITNHSRPVTCAAAAIALRGRETCLSAFAHYINCILQYGGAKKAVFERLSKLAISTVHKNAIGKQKQLSNKYGSGLWLLKRQNEEFITLEAGCQSVNQGQEKNSIDPRSLSQKSESESELLLSDVFRSMEDL